MEFDSDDEELFFQLGLEIVKPLVTVLHPKTLPQNHCLFHSPSWTVKAKTLERINEVTPEMSRNSYLKSDEHARSSASISVFA